MAVAFATTDDVAALYGSLSDAETLRAARLLDQASALLRVKVPGVDSAAASTDPALVATTVAEAVARALRNPGGVRSVSRTTGPFSESVAYSDAASGGGLFFTDDELAVLGVPVAGLVRKVRTLRMGSTEPPYRSPWW